MKLSGFTRLSAKLLAIFFLILGVTLIALFTIIETREYFDERKNLVLNLQELITTQSTPIATALWELDDQKINSFLSEVGKLPFVQGTVVTDGSGKIVATNGDIDTPAKISEFVAQESLVFGRGENPLTLGSIKVIAHDGEILRRVKQRLVTDAIIFFVLFAVLTGATFFATNMVIGKPLTLLQGSIEEIRRGGARKRVDWDANDELGQVVSAYNEMQSRQEKTEAELQASHDNLELRVKERTKELADARDRAKAAEKTLLESEKRLQSILEISPIGWAIRRTDGTMLETNERLCNFLGMSRADVLKTTAMQLYSDPADRLSAVEDIRKDGFVRDREIAFKKADGTTVWALQSLRSAQYKGEPAIFSWDYDITERKRAEEERLRQTQKMDVLGQLTGSVAHDFNNLLTVLRCNIDLLKSPNIGQEQRQSLIKDCVEAVELSSNLTGRLTNFARKELLAETTVDLNTLIAGFSDLLNRSVGKDVSIEYVLSDDTLLPVLVDTVLVEVALLNLAINARDAMPEGGMITVSLSKTIIDGKVESIFGNVEEQPYALVQVSDTGVGMTRETREHAFEAFFTTKDEGKGTGLGLNTVQDLAQSTGGFIQIESEPKKGTTVKIFLPLYEEEIS